MNQLKITAQKGATKLAKNDGYGYVVNNMKINMVGVVISATRIVTNMFDQIR